MNNHSKINSSDYVTLIFYTVILFAICVIYPAAYLISSGVETIQVEESYTKIQSSSNKYMIQTPDETYQNSDSYLFFKFDSSDVYRELEEGSCYEVMAAGWRVPFMSWYRNVIDIRNEVDCS